MLCVILVDGIAGIQVPNRCLRRSLATIRLNCIEIVVSVAGKGVFSIRDCRVWRLPRSDAHARDLDAKLRGLW